ncbi:hypothetical protein ACFLRM_06450 [Acidobacteriota bacterium]
MKLNTMAAVMSFISKVENDSALFYQIWAGKYQELRDVFLDWSKENKTFEKKIKQTYFGVITDAIESTFSFAKLDTAEYELETALSADGSLQEVKKKAKEIETGLKDFYFKAAQQSEGLMADLPGLFKKIAKKREERLKSFNP